MTDLKELELRVENLEARLLATVEMIIKMQETEARQTEILQQMADYLESSKSVVALNKDC